MTGDVKGRTLHARALRALVIFFIIMAVFTVVSRVSASLTMAWVTTARPTEQKIEHIVDAAGTVEKNRELAVRTTGGILVKTVYVVPGQKVGEGEVLAELDMEHLEEQIRQRQEEIELLRLDGENAAQSRRQSEQEQQTAGRRALEDAKNTVTDAQALYDAAAAELQSAADAYHSYQAAHQADIGEETVWQQQLALQEAMKAKQAACDDAFRRLRDAQLNAERAAADAAIPRGTDYTAQIQAIQIAQKERELTALEALWQSGGTIIAPVDGVVTDVHVATGQMTADTAAFTMADLTSGMRCEALISKQDAAYVSVGTGVTLAKNAQKSEGLTIDAMQGNEDGSFTVTVYLDADAPFSIGDAVNLEVKQSSALSRTVVPSGALHVENGNYYVYVAEEAETVLGKQYTLMRVDVRVRDQNGMFAALEDGVLSSESKVVTDSDRYVEAGSRVRLRES